jgi:hypothetical protein
MTLGFFGGWRTKENRELMEYIKAANISVAGFDVQRTGNSFKQILKTAAHKYNMDTVFCSTLEDRYGIIQRELADKKAVYDSVRAKTIQLIADYQQAYRLLSGNKSGNFPGVIIPAEPLPTGSVFLNICSVRKRPDWNNGGWQEIQPWPTISGGLLIVFIKMKTGCVGIIFILRIQ